ncbi:hypothetical protein DICPUDRAFT_98475 [Dictyostelium purpureum]|uniref:Uncharacterized protein n=1 Tax=Dictyostelium purpureum TaxID=5786 RepID=F0ZQN8_DICPU|nr:uncharacterized protein DICPUDRAFT_98475 [Dictyostelium purpureum]EGC33732.1 hypothetical protein DICPUDRAFT_98475 [Dictyostelium purpureum]|eukprot:XP_003289731.1 hypothetical protein DICPUDRAFT_98475 [Dictyostelium purpureum]
MAKADISILVLKEMREGVSVSQLARKYKINETTIRRWNKKPMDIDSIKERAKKQGRKKKIDDRSEQEIIQWIRNGDHQMVFKKNKANNNNSDNNSNSNDNNSSDDFNNDEEVENNVENVNIESQQHEDTTQEENVNNNVNNNNDGDSGENNYNNSNSLNNNLNNNNDNDSCNNNNNNSNNNNDSDNSNDSFNNKENQENLNINQENENENDEIIGYTDEDNSNNNYNEEEEEDAGDENNETKNGISFKKENYEYYIVESTLNNSTPLTFELIQRYISIKHKMETTYHYISQLLKRYRVKVIKRRKLLQSLKQTSSPNTPNISEKANIDLTTKKPDRKKNDFSIFRDYSYPRLTSDQEDTQSTEKGGQKKKRSSKTIGINSDKNKRPRSDSDSQQQIQLDQHQQYQEAEQEYYGEEVEYSEQHEGFDPSIHYHDHHHHEDHHHDHNHDHCHYENQQHYMEFHHHDDHHGFAVQPYDHYHYHGSGSGSSVNSNNGNNNSNGECEPVSYQVEPSHIHEHHHHEEYQHEVIVEGEHHHTIEVHDHLIEEQTEQQEQHYEEVLDHVVEPYHIQTDEIDPILHHQPMEHVEEHIVENDYSNIQIQLQVPLDSQQIIEDDQSQINQIIVTHHSDHQQEMIEEDGHHIEMHQTISHHEIEHNENKTQIIMGDTNHIEHLEACTEHLQESINSHSIIEGEQ